MSAVRRGSVERGAVVPGGVGRPVSGLSRAFRLQLERDGILKGGERLVVAVSGGVDSLVLLHLLRFAPGLPQFRLHAAHFDHAMRPGSCQDALWVRGLCRAWDIPCTQGRATSPPASEAAAREARYRFLWEVMEAEGGDWLLTGHQADDQAETVLFRVLRGTGLRGLAGIPLQGEGRLYRPLLPFFRRDVAAYARRVGLRPREDPTNRDLSISRNYLRHSLLPQVEAKVAPGARRALVRLAQLARANEEGWRSLLPRLMEGVVEARDGDAWAVKRSALLGCHPEVQARILREWLGRHGIRLGGRGTRVLLEFTRVGASGSRLPLPGGWCFRRDFDAFTLERGENAGAASPLTIGEPRSGGGEVVLGGKKWWVVWGGQEPEGARWVFRAPESALAFPLQLRSWSPGDRILLPYGSKKVKKLLAEARIPRPARSQVPLLFDARGRLLWVAGLAVSVVAAERLERLFFVGVRDA